MNKKDRDREEVNFDVDPILKLENIKQLTLSYGWIDLGKQKNPVMVSFRNEETGARMNLYFTTMTITIQPERGGIYTYRSVTAEQLEDILQGNEIL